MSQNKNQIGEGSTRERLLEAAIELFAEKGYSAVSVRDITGKVGLRESSLYNHFKSKDDLLNTIFNIFLREVGESGFPVESVEQGLEQMDLSAFLQHHAYVFRQRITPLMEKVWRIIYMEQFRDGRARKFVINEIMGRPRAFYQKAFRVAAERGMIKTKDPDMLALLYQYAVLTLVWEQMLRQIDGEDITPLLKKRVEMIKFICEAEPTEPSESK